MFVLDTNAVIHAFKGMGLVRERIAAVHPGDVAIPAIVAYELEFGTLLSGNPAKRQRDLERLFGLLTILPFDGRAATRSARLRHELEKSGQKIGPLDVLIAGTVLANGGVFVTHNTREFSRVPGLVLEDWYE